MDFWCWWYFFFEGSFWSFYGFKGIWGGRGGLRDPFEELKDSFPIFKVSNELEGVEGGVRGEYEGF